MFLAKPVLAMPPGTSVPRCSAQAAPLLSGHDLQQTYRVASIQYIFYSTVLFPHDPARSIAERGIAKASCLSVCLWRWGTCIDVSWPYTYTYVGWNSAKIISRLISLTFSLSVYPNMTDLLQREHPNNFSMNRSG